MRNQLTALPGLQLAVALLALLAGVAVAETYCADRSNMVVPNSRCPGAGFRNFDYPGPLGPGDPVPSGGRAPNSEPTFVVYGTRDYVAPFNAAVNFVATLRERHVKCGIKTAGYKMSAGFQIERRAQRRRCSQGQGRRAGSHVAGDRSMDAGDSNKRRRNDGNKRHAAYPKQSVALYG